MSKKRKPSNNSVPMTSRKLEALVKQMHRIRNDGDVSSFTMRELETMRDELLAEING